MKLNVISVCSQYTAEELLASSARAKAQSDFLKLQWEQGQYVRDVEDFLDVLQRSVNENAVTVVLDGSDYYYTKTLIAEGLDLELEEDSKSRQIVEEYCNPRGLNVSGRILDGCKLPSGAEPMNSKETVDQGFILVRGGRCIAVFPAAKKSFGDMFCSGLYPFLLRHGAETAVAQTIAIRESKVKDVEEYLRLFRHGKNILPLVYQEDDRYYLSVTAIRATEQESRQACESLLENIEAEMGDFILTASSAKKEKKKKKSKALREIEEYDPQEGQDKKQKKGGFGIVRKILLLICICTFLGSAGYLGHRYYQSVSNVQDYDSLREVYDNGGFPSIGYPMSYDNAFSGLYQINEDIAGWLSIEGTSLDYPVVQTDDNEYYHRLSFEGDYSLYGVPFVDWKVDLKEPSNNTIIYGHNIKNDDQMFNSLIHYWDTQYFIDHPVIDFHTIYGKRQYKIFAAFVANVNPDHGEVFPYHTFIDADSVVDMQEFLYNVQVRSILNTGVDVLPSDELLTLSTCTYEFDNARFVIVARRLRDGESTEVDASLVSKAANPLMPDIWYQLYGGTKPVLSVPTFEDTVVLSTSENPIVKAEVSYDAALLSDTLEDGLTAVLGAAVQTLAQQEEDTQVLSTTSPATEPPAATTPPAVETTPPAAETPAETTPPVTESPAVTTPPATETTPPAVETPPAEATPADPEETEEEAPAEDEPQEEESAQEEEPEPGPEEELEEEEEDEPVSTYDESEKLSVKLNGKSIKQSAYDVVCMMVQAEMGTTFHQEALKAQAVAAYTYVKYNNSNGISPSVAGKTSISSNVAKAVQAVIGEAIYYNGNYINATYCAANAGVSNNCVDVWGGNLPYLTSVDSEGDEETVHYGYETRLDLDYVADRIESYHNVDPWDYSDDPSDWFGKVTYGAGKYVNTIKICGSSLKGRYVREGLLQSKIRSAAFEVEYDEDREQFIFTTYGYGHGVGMSQLGANYYAKEGWTYDEILEHYYSGTRVK